jgi:hypothetical protein
MPVVHWLSSSQQKTTIKLTYFESAKISKLFFQTKKRQVYLGGGQLVDN